MRFVILQKKVSLEEKLVRKRMNLLDAANVVCMGPYYVLSLGQQLTRAHHNIMESPGRLEFY